MLTHEETCERIEKLEARLAAAEAKLAALSPKPAPTPAPAPTK